MSSPSGTGPPGALPRPHSEAGRYLAAGGLHAEQRYRLQRARRHVRYLHGWGVVCGLLVVPARDPGHPWAVSICPGHAIGPYGDEIEVGAPVRVDIREFLWHQPPAPGATSAKRLVWIGIRHEEVPGRPAPTSPPGCGCADPHYAPSRVGDGYRAEARWNVPEASLAPVDLCEPGAPPCEACPDSPWVWLARVTLPISESDPLTSLNIHNGSRRRLLVSTMAIQTQLIDCCCDDAVPTPG